MSSQSQSGLFEYLVKSREFQQLRGMNGSRSVLELINFSETQKCQIIAWLLNPREGHGLNDYFLKRLVTAAIQGDEAGVLTDKLGLDEMGFESALVATEVNVPVNESDKSGRIDIVVADVSRQVIYVIERKDGTELHSDQLKTYRKWARKLPRWSESSKECDLPECEKKVRPSFNLVPLLLDSQSKKHQGEGNRGKKHFIQLNDDWLVEAILDLLRREILPNRLEYLFTDILGSPGFLSSWDESHDPYFANRDEVAKRFASEGPEIMRKLGAKSIEIGGEKYSPVMISQKVFIEKVVNSSLDLQTKRELAYFARNHDELSFVEDFFIFQSKAEEIREAFTQLVVDYDDDHVYVTVNAGFGELAHWPLWLEFTDLSAESEAEKEHGKAAGYNVQICTSTEGGKKFEWIFEKAAKLVNPKSRSKSYSYEPAELIESLDMYVGSPAHDHVKRFISFANEIMASRPAPG